MQIINVSLAKAYENVNSLKTSKPPDIPVKTEFPDIPRFSRTLPEFVLLLAKFYAYR